MFDHENAEHPGGVLVLLSITLHAALCCCSFVFPAELGPFYAKVRPIKEAATAAATCHVRQHVPLRISSVSACVTFPSCHLHIVVMYMSKSQPGPSAFTSIACSLLTTPLLC
jgi:hypothetical protein